jgi:hypothetical protein
LGEENQGWENWPYLLTSHRPFCQLRLRRRTPGSGMIAPCASATRVLEEMEDLVLHARVNIYEIMRCKALLKTNIDI